MYYQDKTLQNKIHGAKFLGFIRKSESTIHLNTDRGIIAVSVSGDCCSHSIFYDVVVPEECYGAEITGFDTWDRESQVSTEEQVIAKAKVVAGWEVNTEHECLSIWDVKFETTNGAIYLRHVNSSNGYYDGMVSISCYY